MKLKILAEEFLIELSGVEVYNKYYSGISYDDFVDISKSDPKSILKTGVDGIEVIKLGRYSKILLKLFIKKQLRLEDLERANDYLKIAYKYHVPLYFDKINSLSDIYNEIKEYVVLDDHHDLNTILRSLTPESDYKLVHNGDNWYIFIPLNEKSACYLGGGTEWCTAQGPYSLNKSYRDRTNRFSSYSSNNDLLYIIINKNDENIKYQFHFGTNQYMDQYDRRIKIKDFINKHNEILHFFFPSFIRETTNEEKKWEGNHINILETDDAYELIKLHLRKMDEPNPLINTIITKNENYINKLIYDESKIKDTIEFDRYGIRFYLNDTYDTSRITEVKETLSGLRYYIDNARSHLYDRYREDINEYNDVFEPFFKEYYNQNHKYILEHMGYVNYETFKADQYESFIETPEIEDEFVDITVDKTLHNYEENIEKEIEHIREYIYVDYDNEVEIKIIPFISFLIKNNIERIINNLSEVLDKYIEYSDINLNDDYQFLYEHQTEYPEYNELKSTIVDYFDKVIMDNAVNPECTKLRKTFRYIYENIFKKNQIYENDHVRIHILDLKVNCNNESIKIEYKNKDTNKTYTGYVKVVNLPVYVTNYQLFEEYIIFKKNIT